MTLILPNPKNFIGKSVPIPTMVQLETKTMGFDKVLRDAANAPEAILLPYLKVPPVDSPETAVKVAIAGKAREA
jgi:hypothetical protein